MANLSPQFLTINQRLQDPSLKPVHSTHVFHPIRLDPFHGNNDYKNAGDGQRENE
jgi:hypothetical protein